MGDWTPTRIRWVNRTLQSSTGAALVETDQGTAYAKLLGNPEGPHALLCELVGSRAAAWLGLRTFDFGLVTVSEGGLVTLIGGSQRASFSASLTREAALLVQAALEAPLTPLLVVYELLEGLRPAQDLVVELDVQQAYDSLLGQGLGKLATIELAAGQGSDDLAAKQRDRLGMVLRAEIFHRHTLLAPRIEGARGRAG